MSHADDRIMTFPVTGMTKMKRIITWCHRDLITVREFIIQRSSKIKIFCFISCSCTHSYLLLKMEFFTD